MLACRRRSRRTAPRSAARPPGSLGSGRRALREPLRAELLEQPVGVHQVDEGGRDRPMLGLALLEQHVCARGDGMHDAMSRPLTSPTPPRAAAPIRAARPAGSSPLSRADAGGIERRGERRAEPDLAGVGDRLHLERLGRRRARDQQLAVHAAGDEEVESPVPIPTDIRSVSEPLRGGSGRRVDGSLHLPGGAARRASCPGPSKSSSSASPPHLSRPAPQS